MVWIVLCSQKRINSSTRSWRHLCLNLGHFYVVTAQVIQSDLRVLPETIESDAGLLRNPISSGEHRPDLIGFSSDSFRSDSGPEYIGKDPIETNRKQLKDPLTLTKIRRSENRGKHKIQRHSVGFQQTLISDFELQQPEEEFLKISTRVGSNFTTIFLRFQSNFTSLTRLPLQFARHFPDFPEDFANISFGISPRISLVFH